MTTQGIVQTFRSEHDEIKTYLQWLDSVVYSLDPPIRTVIPEVPQELAPYGERIWSMDWQLAYLQVRLKDHIARAEAFLFPYMDFDSALKFQMEHDELVKQAAVLSEALQKSTPENPFTGERKDFVQTAREAMHKVCSDILDHTYSEDEAMNKWKSI